MSGYHQGREKLSTRVGEGLLFAVAKGFEIATRRIDLWRLEGTLGRAGRLIAPMLPVTRNRAGANLDLVYPALEPAARRHLIAGAGEHFVRLCVEYAHFGRFARDIEIRAEGLEHLTAAMAQGKGAVLVTAHYGNWEAARLAALRAGHEVGIIYRAFNNRYLTAYTDDLITAAGRPVLHKGSGGMRRLIAHVAGGGAALVLVDQRNTGAPRLPFLGHPAETVTVVAQLASRSGAALIPVRARRNVAARRFDVTVEQPIPPGTPEERMTAVNARLSAWIEAEPEQWFWFHRRWKQKRA